MNKETMLYHEFCRRGAPNIRVYLNRVLQRGRVEFIVWDGTTRAMSWARFGNLYEHVPDRCQACQNTTT